MYSAPPSLPYRRWRVAQEDIDAYRAHEGYGGGYPEAPLPRAMAHRCHDVAAEDGHDRGSYRVGGVPDRHLGSQLIGGNPVGEQTVARGESRALEEVVQQQEQAEDEHHGVDKLRSRALAGDEVAQVGAKTEGVVGCGTEQQSYRHVVAGVEAVGEIAVEKSRRTIDHRHQGHDDTEAGLGDAIFGGEAGDGKREVLSHEVEDGIAYHGGEDGAPLPVFECLGHICQ